MTSSSSVVSLRQPDPMVASTLVVEIWSPSGCRWRVAIGSAG